LEIKNKRKREERRDEGRQGGKKQEVVKESEAESDEGNDNNRNRERGSNRDKQGKTVAGCKGTIPVNWNTILSRRSFLASFSNPCAA
jgi:hypothetical protein